MNTTRHLDIGCGSQPRNPFQRDELHGVDIIEQNDVDFSYKQCNVVLEPLPYADSTFDSISAYDFLEHIPRFTIMDGKSCFPFIDFMNEAYRVLKAGGIFYAITPGYPREEAFLDPTHVNFITRGTHTYFTAPKFKARVYGFNGKFEVNRVKWIKFSQGVKNDPWPIKFLKNIFYTLYYTKKSHLLWEFTAVK